MTDATAPTTLPPRAEIHAPSHRSVLVKRFFACLAGGVVLAMMVGKQEGSQTDYGYAFRKSVLEPRIVVFLGIGVLLFLAITYLARHRAVPDPAGFLAIHLRCTSGGSGNHVDALVRPRRVTASSARLPTS